MSGHRERLSAFCKLSAFWLSIFWNVTYCMFMGNEIKGTFLKGPWPHVELWKFFSLIFMFPSSPLWMIFITASSPLWRHQLPRFVQVYLLWARMRQWWDHDLRGEIKHLKQCCMYVATLLTYARVCNTHSIVQSTIRMSSYLAFNWNTPQSKNAYLLSTVPQMRRGCQFWVSSLHLVCRVQEAVV